MTLTAAALHQHAVAQSTAGQDAVLVQVRIRAEVVCGRLAGFWKTPEGVELHKVETEAGEVWAQGRNLRLCSGVDKRCHCLADDFGRATARASASEHGRAGVGGGTC